MALLNSMTMRYFLGYRFEFWPREEDDMKNLFAKCGLENIDIKRLVWVENFENGGKIFDFFASTSGYGGMTNCQLSYEKEKR